MADAVYIDWDDGIKRVMNNAKLYKKLLGKFQTGTKTNLESLKAAIDAGDLAKAQTEAHTIKGVAANLSLMETQRLALEIETQLKAGAASPEAYQALSDAFNATLAAIDEAVASHA